MYLPAEKDVHTSIGTHASVGLSIACNVQKPLATSFYAPTQNSVPVQYTCTSNTATHACTERERERDKKAHFFANSPSMFQEYLHETTSFKEMSPILALLYLKLGQTSISVPLSSAPQEWKVDF